MTADTADKDCAVVVGAGSFGGDAGSVRIERTEPASGSSSRAPGLGGACISSTTSTKDWETPLRLAAKLGLVELSFETEPGLLDSCVPGARGSKIRKLGAAGTTASIPAFAIV